MSDESKAGALSIAYIIIIFIGGSLADSNKLAGAIICIAATMGFIGILYASWLSEQKDKRLNRYMKHAGERAEKACSGQLQSEKGQLKNEN
jgi:hypothetical protein